MKTETFNDLETDLISAWQRASYQQKLSFAQTNAVRTAFELLDFMVLNPELTATQIIELFKGDM